MTVLMWIFTRYGFYSIASAHRPDGSADPDTVMVRARRQVHLQRLQARFPAIAGAAISTSDERDYRYRILAAKTAWVSVVSETLKSRSGRTSRTRRHDTRDRTARLMSMRCTVCG